MKINHGYQDSRATSAQESVKTQEAAAAQARAARAGAGAGQANSNDEVNLSSLASALQEALTVSPERSAYLDRLAADYSSGSYQPDIGATANGVIADALLDPSDNKK